LLKSNRTIKNDDEESRYFLLKVFGLLSGHTILEGRSFISLSAWRKKKKRKG